MEYIEVAFEITPHTSENVEIITAWISDLPFDSFSDTEKGLNAYAPSNDFSEENLKLKLEDFSIFKVKYSTQTIEDQNWNKVWEENYFEPIIIGDKCLVRGSFHENTPKVEWEIVIDPKMSFGSGHHSTTKMMLEHLLEIDVSNKSVLDMGCGTGILAILSAMRRAKKIVAIDIDEWAYNNTIENADNNKQAHIEVKQGGAEIIGEEKFDVILANINTNILLRDMPVYKKSLTLDGMLIMSGFYSVDKTKIIEKSLDLGMKVIQEKEENDWCAIIFS